MSKNKPLIVGCILKTVVALVFLIGVPGSAVVQSADERLRQALRGSPRQTAINFMSNAAGHICKMKNTTRKPCGKAIGKTTFSLKNKLFAQIAVVRFE